MRRFLANGVPALVLALAISGCVSARRAPETVIGAVIVDDPAEIVKPGKERVSVGTVQIESAEVGQDDRRITLKFFGGSSRCWSVEQVQVGYNPELVSLEITGGYHRLPPSVRCTAPLIPYSLVIALKEAVAGRLVDTTD